MPPARRSTAADPDQVVQTALRQLLDDIDRQERAEERARAANAHMRRLTGAQRAVSRAREDAVAEMLHAGRTLKSVALALDLSVNAVVQIREMRLARLRAEQQEQ